MRFCNVVDFVNQLEKEKQQSKAGNLTKQLTSMDAAILSTSVGFRRERSLPTLGLQSRLHHGDRLRRYWIASPIKENFGIRQRFLSF